MGIQSEKIDLRLSCLTQQQEPHTDLDISLAHPWSIDALVIWKQPYGCHQRERKGAKAVKNSFQAGCNYHSCHWFTSILDNGNRQLWNSSNILQSIQDTVSETQTSQNSGTIGDNDFHSAYKNATEECCWKWFQDCLPEDMIFITDVHSLLIVIVYLNRTCLSFTVSDVIFTVCG